MQKNTKILFLFIFILTIVFIIKETLTNYNDVKPENIENKKINVNVTQKVSPIPEKKVITLPKQNSENLNIREKIKKYLDEQQMSGVLFLQKEGLEPFIYTNGFANQKKKIKNTQETQFVIGSLTKLFTATALLKLQAQGKLDFQKPIKNYIKNEDLIFLNDVTIHELLVYSSGIEESSSLESFQKFNLTLHTPFELIDYYSEFPLSDFKGQASHYIYNQTNYNILGFIIEKISGKSFGVFIKQEIFNPLKMSSSLIPGKTFLSSLLETNKRLAMGYSQKVKAIGKGSYKSEPIEADDLNLSTLYASESAISTVFDLKTFTKALFEGNLLPEEQLKMMTTPYVESSVPGVFAGYGLFVTKTAENNPLYLISGVVEGYQALLIYDPTEKVTLILLSNVNDGRAATIGKELLYLLTENKIY